MKILALKLVTGEDVLGEIETESETDIEIKIEKKHNNTTDSNNTDEAEFTMTNNPHITEQLLDDNSKIIDVLKKINNKF